MHSYNIVELDLLLKTYYSIYACLSQAHIYVHVGAIIYGW